MGTCGHLWAPLGTSGHIWAPLDTSGHLWANFANLWAPCLIFLILFAGFYGTATGLVGCMPCPDGSYSAAGDKTCQKCPMGSYASISTGLRDYMKCPVNGSPLLNLLVKNIHNNLAESTQCNDTMAVGAIRCTMCPPTAPYTYQEGSVGQHECQTCSFGKYWNSNQCLNCSQECVESMYEVQPCTAMSNRECFVCENTQCGLIDGLPGPYFCFVPMP